MPDARAAILARIREQLAQPASLSAEREYDELLRSYTRQGALSTADLIHLLLERLADYDAEVIELSEHQIADAVTAVLARDHEFVLVAPSALNREWLPHSAESSTEILEDGAEDNARLLSIATLTRAQAVLTACAGAIAETGTLLLVHSDAAQGRRVLTLLPDHHLCVLRRSQVVETVAEGLAMIARHHAAAITTISGPSATADIEMTRIRGVHGPRRLTVLLVS